jgi:hypothetical protein
VADGTLASLRSGYDRNSGITLALLLCTYAVVAVVWRRYIDLSQRDVLLVAIWVFMTALMCWGIAPRRDLVRALVGFGGGLCIEAWGTVTEIWWYFTAERPPLWILPAWPVASIAIDRLARATDLVLPSGEHRPLWFALLPPFVVGMTWWVWPYTHHPFTWFAIVMMVVVLLWPGNRRQDVTLMLAGAGLGFFLEYWGTSRRCWTYYTLATPPVAAVFAHGFAAVAFQRVAALGDHVLSRITDAGIRGSEPDAADSLPSSGMPSDIPSTR